MTRSPAKTAFDILRRRWRLSLAALSVVAFAAAGMRLAAGPVDVEGLRFLIIERLERDIPGSRVSIGQMKLVWFHDTNALGLRLSDLVIIDAKGRRIASAKHLEAALAIDSLLVMHLAPARLSADQFFISASVSEAGRYELGYEASGKPEALGGLDRLFLDLVGSEKLGSPISFTRSVILKDGVITLHQVNSDLKWRAELDALSFTKRAGRIRANLGLKIDAGGHVSKLYTISEAEVGLKSATIAARIENLTPSEVFPSAGFSRSLSHFHAAVNGRGNLSYNATTGFESVFVDISAGKGLYDFGKVKPSFDSMKVVANYAPKTRTVSFDRFELVSHLIDADLKGKVSFTPENKARKVPLSFNFDFDGPRVSGKLADDFKAQTLKDVHFTGTFVPERREIRIDTGKGFLDKSAIETKGLIYTDAKGQLGADLTASIKGDFSKEQVFVFWPENLSSITRENLIERIKGGSFSNARFTLKAPPGHITPDNLKNEDLRLDFDFRDMGLSFDRRMKDAANLKGSGTLLGDSFSLQLTSGRLVNVDLDEGGLNVPSFHKATGLTHTHIWLKSHGEGADIIEAIDPVTGNELAQHGFNHERLSGKAEVRLDISFSTFEHLSEKNLDIRFDAQIKDAGLKKAALGWDLTKGTLNVTGDLLANRLTIKGVADLGPYRGQIAYASAFVPHQMKIDFSGDFDAAPFGGSPTLRVPIKGDFLIEGDRGTGQIRSDVYNGGVVWSGRETSTQGDAETRNEPTQVDLDGMILTRGLVDQGLPIFARLKPEIPTKLSLLRAGNIWSGVMTAEVLTGDIAYIQGAGSRLVYKATITPTKARAFGFGGLPMFKSTRHLTLNIGLESDTKEALISLDKLRGVLGWSQVPGEIEPLRTFSMKVTPEDWAVVGLPVSFFQPKAPIEITSSWRHDSQATRGTIYLKHQDTQTPLDFVMPNEPLNGLPGGEPFAARITGTIDDGLLEALGYNHDPLAIRGKLGGGFTLIEKPQGYASVLNIDSRDAKLSVKGSQWEKPVGEAAQFALSFDEGETRQGTNIPGLNITRIYGEGPRVAIEGRAALAPDGQLEFADFSKLSFTNLADLSLRIYQNDNSGTRLISLNGKQLDLRPFMTSKSGQAATGPSAKPAQADSLKTRLLVDLQQVSVAPEAFGAVHFDATLDPKLGITGAGDFASQNGTKNRFSIAPVDEDDTEGKMIASRFRLESDDLGNFLRTALDVKQIYGGKGEIVGYYTQDQTDILVTGKNLRAKQIPAMAQLLSLASLQGLADTMTGEGIAFSEINVPLRMRNGLIYIDNGWAKGDALGFNVRGTTSQDGQLKLSGVLIPAYRVNAMFGDVHDKGEGLVGIKYAINGSQKAPMVAVDPLSLVMPGFLRRWFERRPPAAIEPLDLPTLRTGDKRHSLLGETDEALPEGVGKGGGS